MAKVTAPKIIEDLTEEEAYLYAILSDQSGLDQAEFLWVDEEKEDSCFRAWPFQWPWYRCTDRQQVDLMARSVGKSLSIQLRAFAFPLLHPGQEMVICAPELNHLEPITDLIETRLNSTRLSRSMLMGGRSGVTHRPLKINFRNGARIMGRIPQKTGVGVKGCAAHDTPVLTSDGYVLIQDVKVGDLVLTQTGTWEPVERIEMDINDCFRVTGQGSHALTVSCDHRFLAVENLAGAKAKRSFTEAGFIDVQDLIDSKAYWATPAHFEPLPVHPVNWNEGRTKLDESSEAFWWIVGRYLADGFLTSQRGQRGRVYWTVHPKDQPAVFEHLEKLGWNYSVKERDHSSADVIEACSTPVFRWLDKNFGRRCYNKRVPGFVFGLPENLRKAIFDGYFSGDGHWDEDRSRWSAGSSSIALILGMQMVAQSLGYYVNCSGTQPKTTEIMGVPLKDVPRYSWIIQVPKNSRSIKIGEFNFGKVKKVVPVGPQKVYNLITADHTYVTGSIISHNIHPVWLEMDESQDFPHPGWIELFETLKRGNPNAIWRAHGVTRGIHDDFWAVTKPDSGWTVHRATAMHRPPPYWSDEEREDKILLYHGRESSDYRRNLLGLHGEEKCT